MHGPNSAASAAQERNGEPRTRTALVLNKVDRVHPKERLLELSQQLHAAPTCARPHRLVAETAADH